MKKKRLIIAVVVVLLLMACIHCLSPIYKRFNKPRYKSYIDAKEWYGKIDCTDLSQVRDFCERRGYSTDYYVLVDFSIPSGKKRFFVYDLQRGKRVMSSYCMHGSGKGNTDANPKFSNELGSGCSSLGRYVMVGKGGRRFKNSIRLRGIDKTNNRAAARGIMIHSAGKVTRFSGKRKYIPIGSESLGCFTVSRDCVAKVIKIYRSSSKRRPVMIYAKYK